jgi:hypothetical protein
MEAQSVALRVVRRVGLLLEAEDRKSSPTELHIQLV